MAQPRATASSGLRLRSLLATIFWRGRPVMRLSMRPMTGMRVAPPTSSTASSSRSKLGGSLTVWVPFFRRRGTCATRACSRTVRRERSKSRRRGRQRRSKVGRSRGWSRSSALPPRARSPVVTSARARHRAFATTSRLAESSRLQRSASASKRRRAVGARMATRCVSKKRTASHSARAASKSSPPSLASPPTASSDASRSLSSTTDASNVPPPRSNTSTVCGAASLPSSDDEGVFSSRLARRLAP
mmetsp:Transcript_11173/g.33502  ORF Transcript_11173/g.33502 Transcript_11173/m.33502 type:complete len:245 (-) Transcript_11173:1380-2114(-)